MILLKIIGYLLVFASVLFLIFVITKFIGNKTKLSMKGKNISVIESITLGIDKQIHLIKVVNEFILISSCGKSIEFITKIEIQDENELEMIEDEFNFKGIFENYLSNFNLKKKNTKYSNAKFKENLGKLKNITNLYKTKDKNSDGDE